MDRKIFELELKELTEEGKFSGHLSTFENVDSGGDIVERGAFKKTLRENKAFAFLWAHQGMPDTVAGSFTGQEDERGLAIDGGFYVDLEGGLKAYKTAKRLRADGVKIGLSMGYRAVKWAYDTIDGATVRRLKEIKLNEGSITLWPMNDQAAIESIKEEGEEEVEMKPYPSEHACRLEDPGKFERFVRMKRNHKGKVYSVIIGFIKGGGSKDQAYRYPKESWTEAEARAHCKDHDGSFEAASKNKELTFVCKSCGETLTFTEPVDATQPKAEPSESTKGIISPVIEGLEEGRAPRKRLLGWTLDNLKKS